MMVVPAQDVAVRLETLRERISRVGDLERIRIVAVTKGFDVEALKLAREAGLVDIGENYAQEAKAKNEQVDSLDVRWHFIGRLQRNKVRLLSPFVDLWQSVDSASLASEIAKRALGASVLLQVDLAGMPERGGCSFADVEGLLAHATEAGLRVEGLMGVGVPGDPENSRQAFRDLKHRADQLGLAEVSMGMSADIEVAVEEGATIVRAGSALFGQRRYN